MVAPTIQYAEPKDLTNRQRAFAEGIHFDRKSQFRAYADAGYEFSRREVADACASQLIRNPKIKAYLGYLRKVEVTEKILSRQRKLELLSDLALNSESPRVRLGAIEILNVMQGDNCWNKQDSSAGLANILDSLRNTTGLPSMVNSD